MEATHTTSSKSPNSKEEAQHRTKPTRTPAFPTRQSRLPRLISQIPNPTQKPATREHNTFDESFGLALHRQPTAHDGATDEEQLQEEELYDDRTPLLNAIYNPSPIKTTTQRTRNPTTHRHPLPPPQKSKPSLSISLWHEVCHNSQYTRPAAEILREVLEERYPAASAGEGGGLGGHGGSDEEASLALLGGKHGGRKRRWWKRGLRR